jgi:NAD-dependent deacetylase
MKSTIRQPMMWLILRRYQHGIVMQNWIERAAQDLVSSRKVVALTGAGISVESGIPPFRGKGGVWEKIDPMKYAHIDALISNPKEVWRVLISEMTRLVATAQPNAAHKGLARLERLGILKTIITQNIDGLHQKAGNTDVIEFHGNFAWLQCMACKRRRRTGEVVPAQIPPYCECGGIYRPECIFFGEMIPPKFLMRSRQVSADCDVMLVIGTSAVVQPASFMPVVAKEAGARVIEINPEVTPLTHHVSDYLIKGKAGETIDAILGRLTQLRG